MVGQTLEDIRLELEEKDCRPVNPLVDPLAGQSSDLDGWERMVGWTPRRVCRTDWKNL